jgi:hypothetical protein
MDLLSHEGVKKQCSSIKAGVGVGLRGGGGLGGESTEFILCPQEFSYSNRSGGSHIRKEEGQSEGSDRRWQRRVISGAHATAEAMAESTHAAHSSTLQHEQHVAARQPHSSLVDFLLTAELTPVTISLISTPRYR